MFVLSILKSMAEKVNETSPPVVAKIIDLTF